MDIHFCSFKVVVYNVRLYFYQLDAFCFFKSFTIFKLLCLFLRKYHRFLFRNISHFQPFLLEMYLLLNVARRKNNSGNIMTFLSEQKTGHSYICCIQNLLFIFVFMLYLLHGIRRVS